MALPTPASRTVKKVSVSLSYPFLASVMAAPGKESRWCGLGCLSTSHLCIPAVEPQYIFCCFHFRRIKSKSWPMKHKALCRLLCLIRSGALGQGSVAPLAPGGTPRGILSPTGRKAELSLVCDPARVPGCVAAWKPPSPSLSSFLVED